MHRFDLLPKAHGLNQLAGDKVRQLSHLAGIFARSGVCIDIQFGAPQFLLCQHFGERRDSPLYDFRMKGCGHRQAPRLEASRLAGLLRGFNGLNCA